MQINYCDLCEVPLVLNKVVYNLAIGKVEERREASSFASEYEIKKYMEEYNERIKNIKVYKICEECKKVMDHILSLRKKEVKQILAEISKLEGKS